MAGPWEQFTKLYTIDKELLDFTELLVKSGIKPFSSYTLDEARKTFLNFCVTAAGDVKFDGHVSEITVPSPDAKAGIPVSVYKPTKVAATPAILIYFHGGGLVLFERKCLETALKKVAMDSGSIILNVEYRLLPDQCSGYGPFNDGVTVTKWVLENKQKVGGQPGSKVGVGGDSSGGQIAISVTNDVQCLAFQVLIYPQCDTGLKKPSVTEFAACPILPAPDLNWFINLVSKDLPNQDTDPRVCPLARTNLKTSPPTLILIAEIDPLRDGAVAFSEMLKSAGVDVTSEKITGVPHIFFGMCGVLKTKCAESYCHVVKFIKRFQ
uniref:Alpha/beta hydrolase fold-3 domain-containing protein n=1 Tax=Arion vulgaris TaxID=1028688 RepID=A0A0B7BFI8_9EUPU